MASAEVNYVPPLDKRNPVICCPVAGASKPYPPQIRNHDLEGLMCKFLGILRRQASSPISTPGVKNFHISFFDLLLTFYTVLTWKYNIILHVIAVG